MPTIDDLKKCLSLAGLAVTSEDGQLFANLFFKSSKTNSEISTIINIMINEECQHFTKVVPQNSKTFKKYKKAINSAIKFHTPDLAIISYKQFLETQYWMSIRQAKLVESGERCESCNSRSSLQVHHLNYDFRGNDHKRMDLLVVLCDYCHGKRHSK